MMATFRPYTAKEIRDAAQAYGVDPDFAEAVYAVESSRGTNPAAMKARTVKRKRDSTIVRGPFQLEDDTTADLIRNEKLGNVNVDDPDVHLDLAMRQMRKLYQQFNGDYDKMAQAYLGGPGSVGTQNKDELGTSVGVYSNKIMAEMSKLRGQAREPQTYTADATPSYPSADEMDAMLMPDSPFGVGASLPADDLFGIPAMAASTGAGPVDDVMGIWPGLEHLDAPPTQTALDDSDLRAYIARLADEEFEGKDFAAA